VSFCIRVLACLDVGYGDTAVTAACVAFSDWPDVAPAFEEVVRSPPVAADYVPGQFFRRELPFLLELLGRLRDLPAVLIVDGYVWLGPERRGLGAALHEALGGRAAVVGVAKTEFAGAAAEAVLRGASRRPLYVTAAGMSAAEAAAGVRAMHGPHRIPTLLARADRLSRG
jgi:deoxyribonuclease V